MKNISKQEFELYHKINEQKNKIDESEFIYSMFKKRTLNITKEKQKLVLLVKGVNEFENIGEVETYESLGENARFIKWYNTLSEYSKIKSEKTNV